MEKVVLESQYVDVKIEDAKIVIEISPIAALEALAAKSETKLDDKAVAIFKALLEKQA